MVDCNDSNSHEENSLQYRVHCTYDDAADLNDLTFTGYKYNQHEQEVVPVLKFDRSKLSIKKLGGNNFKNLYSNKPFLLVLRPFAPW